MSSLPGPPRIIPIATLDGVTVTGVDAVTIDSPAPASTTLEVGVTTAATLLNSTIQDTTIASPAR